MYVPSHKELDERALNELPKHMQAMCGFCLSTNVKHDNGVLECNNCKTTMPNGYAERKRAKKS